jgi:hydroxymethylpyrimidine/phosphomethylpyrimidine kinase
MRACVLVIAASDSSGGAGLVRDVAVLTHLGVSVRCAVTAVTAQSDLGVQATHHIPPALISAQIALALAAGGVTAIKIGMLGTHATVQAVIEALPPRASIPIVLDPVLRASSGGVLLDPPGQRLLCEGLLPRVTLLTPNIPEAALLLDEPVAFDEQALLGQAERLLALGPSAVLLKGGHSSGTSVVDLLLTPAGSVRISTARVPGTLRGSGCMLSSAIAAGLADGADLETASRDAQTVVAAAWRGDPEATRRNIEARDSG